MYIAGTPPGLQARDGQEAGGTLTVSTVLDQVRGGLIVSCQALPDEPLHGSHFMARMARAAYEGGAVGIRANGADDIRAIRQEVPLPVIGLVKRQYPGSPVFITPTLREVGELVNAGAAMVAVDSTSRSRPDGMTLPELFALIRSRWGIPILADVSSPEEAVRALEAGAQAVATTLIGYTGEGAAPPAYEPPLKQIRAIIEAAKPMPVIAEGRIWEPADARRCLDWGALAVVIGTAITRPQIITARFVQELEGSGSAGVRTG